MKNRHRYGNLLGYVDISMNLLMCFVILFAFAFMLIKLQETVTETKSKLSTTSKLVIHLNWPDDNTNDIDLWARSTNPKTVVGFKSKDSTNMFLDNDNLGKMSHVVKKSDGSVVTTFGNNENIQIKDCTNTRITVNLHYYRNNSDSGEAVSALVELIKLEPYALIRLSTVKLARPGQERTAFQFDLDEACNVSNITEEQSLFVLSELPTPSGANSMGLPPPGPTAPGGP